MGRRVSLTLLLAMACTKATAGDEPVPPPGPVAAAEPDSAEPSTAPVADSEACPHRVGDDAILVDFWAFGPSAMSHGLLGQAWWQWDGEGHATEAANGTVWVVVHDDVPPDELATRFPVREADQCDHRYVSVDEALLYLEDHIAELDGLGEEAPEFAPLLETLRTTRQDLLQHFRPAPP